MKQPKGDYSPKYINNSCNSMSKKQKKKNNNNNSNNNNNTKLKNGQKT